MPAGFFVSQLGPIYPAVPHTGRTMPGAPWIPCTIFLSIGRDHSASRCLRRRSLEYSSSHFSARIDVVVASAWLLNVPMRAAMCQVRPRTGRNPYRTVGCRITIKALRAIWRPASTACHSDMTSAAVLHTKNPAVASGVFLPTLDTVRREL
jgi:hypothetical protein